MPKSATILMIRHAEKPASGTGLSMMGQQRAQAYSIYFQNYLLNGKALNLNYLFAAEDSKQSNRSLLTITPFSKATGLPIDAKHKNDDYPDVVHDLTNHSKYDGANILICWHHGKLLDFAKALGVESSKLPATANWPSNWPDEVFGWLLQLVFDANGSIDPIQTICISQKLMFGDNGQMPAGPNA